MNAVGSAMVRNLVRWGRKQRGQKQDPSIGWKTTMKNVDSLLMAVGASDEFTAKETLA